MRERVGEATVMGIILIAIGLGLMSISAAVYQACGIGKVEISGVVYNVGPIVLGTILRLIGVAASVLIVVGVAEHFGVHSALVVATVTLVGYDLRRIMTHARDSLKRVQLTGPEAGSQPT